MKNSISWVFFFLIFYCNHRLSSIRSNDLQNSLSISEYTFYDLYWEHLHCTEYFSTCSPTSHWLRILIPQLIMWILKLHLYFCHFAEAILCSYFFLVCTFTYKKYNYFWLESRLKLCVLTCILQINKKQNIFPKMQMWPTRTLMMNCWRPSLVLTVLCILHVGA